MSVGYANDQGPMCLSEVLLNADDKAAVLRDFMADVLRCCRAADLDTGDIDQALTEAELDVGYDDDETDTMQYTGWDRRHDDNKAEGRPAGGQWSAEGADYSHGFKVYTKTD